MKHLSWTVHFLFFSCALAWAGPDDILKSALEHAKVHDFVTARDELKKIVSETPANALAWFNLGSMEFNLSHFDEAAQAFGQVIVLQSPLTEGAILCRAKCFRKIKDWEKAAGELAKLKEANESSELVEPAKRELARAIQAQGTEALEKDLWKEALTAYDLSDRFYNDPDTQYARALALSGLQRFDEARQAFKVYLGASSDLRYESDARFFLNRIESGTGPGAGWVNLEISGGYNSNVFLSGKSESSSNAGASEVNLTAGWQMTRGDRLLTRLSYYGDWIENYGQSLGRFTTQLAQAELGYFDPEWFLRVVPGITYQTVGTTPYQLQATLGLSVQRSLKNWRGGLSYEIDKNYGQISTYNYLNGYNHWGQLYVDYLAPRFEIRFSYNLLYEDIQNLTSGSTLLPLKDLVQGPGVKVYWSPVASWELLVNCSYLFHHYHQLAQPGNLERRDGQLLSYLRLTKRLGQGWSLFLSHNFILNSSTLGASSNVSDRNYLQYFVTTGIAWNPLS